MHRWLLVALIAPALAAFLGDVPRVYAQPQIAVTGKRSMVPACDYESDSRVRLIVKGASGTFRVKAHHKRWTSLKVPGGIDKVAIPDDNLFAVRQRTDDQIDIAAKRKSPGAAESSVKVWTKSRATGLAYEATVILSRAENIDNAPERADVIHHSEIERDRQAEERRVRTGMHTILHGTNSVLVAQNGNTSAATRRALSRIIGYVHTAHDDAHYLRFVVVNPDSVNALNVAEVYVVVPDGTRTRTDEVLIDSRTGRAQHLPVTLYPSERAFGSIRIPDHIPPKHPRGTS